MVYAEYELSYDNINEQQDSKSKLTMQQTCPKTIDMNRFSEDNTLKNK